MFRGPYLHVSDHGTDTALRFDAGTGAFVGTFASHPNMGNPNGMVFGPGGNFHVISGTTDSVFRFDAQTGAFLDVFCHSKVLGPGGTM